jgi:hypothetical protein
MERSVPDEGTSLAVQERYVQKPGILRPCIAENIRVDSCHRKPRISRPTMKAKCCKQIAWKLLDLKIELLITPQKNVIAND